MRIAHLTATFPPYYAGAGNVCYHNARLLTARGYDVEVVTARYPGAVVDPPGVRVHRLRPVVRVGNAPLLPQIAAGNLKPLAVTGPNRLEALPDVPTNMPEGETTGFYLRQLVGLHPWWSPPGELFQIPETHDATVAGVDIEDLRVVTPRFVRNAERLGVDVQVWTVNEVEQMHRLLDAGVHGILTDHPDRFRAVICESANPVHSLPDSPRMREALT